MSVCMLEGSQLTLSYSPPLSRHWVAAAVMGRRERGGRREERGEAWC